MRKRICHYNLERVVLYILSRSVVLCITGGRITFGRMAMGEITRAFAFVLRVLMITSLIIFSQLATSVPIYDESQALIALKASMNDPLMHLADWKLANGTTSPCQWTGVTCGNSSTVVSLNLSNMNLSGVVSSELGSLKNLVNISLDRNNFTGELPAELVTLSQLQYLNVSTNSFSFGLPSYFSQLQLLQVSVSYRFPCKVLLPCYFLQ